MSEAINYINNSTHALLVTVGEKNIPYAREIGPFVNNGLDIYFVSRTDSEKVKQFTLNPYVTFYFPNINPNPKEFKSVTITGTTIRIPAGKEFGDILEKLGHKSAGYVKYISKEGFDIWTIFKMTTITLQFTDYSKAARTVKFEVS
jgi:nitroimidazol reductase NimA-like FMN-containing flavoprotein (pyridoxamine 5'-phosphate oxidase superfamily)